MIDKHIFPGYMQPHWCKIARLENLTFDLQQYIGIPYEDGSTEEYDECKMYQLPWESYTDEDLLNWNRTIMTSSAEVVSCDNGYVHDRSVMVVTTVTEVRTGLYHNQIG